MHTRMEVKNAVSEEGHRFYTLAVWTSGALLKLSGHPDPQNRVNMMIKSINIRQAFGVVSGTEGRLHK